MILNDLLLNFHVNRQRGLQLLQLLIQEDSQEIGTIHTIQDYLQPLLLGVLLNFDRKLEKPSERESALRSLIELFRLCLLSFYVYTNTHLLQIYRGEKFECDAF